MKGPTRFSEGEDVAAKRLMVAMREERPPAGAQRRAVLALGITAATTVTTGAALGSTSVAPVLSKSLGLFSVKGLWTSVAVSVAVGTGAAALHVSEIGTRVTGPPADHSALEARAKLRPARRRNPPLAGKADRDPAPPAAAASDMMKPAEPAAKLRESRPAPRIAAPPVEDPLAREVQVLDEARQALLAGAPQQALATLDRFARQFPRGKLASEAFVMRLDALVRAGRKGEARTLAERHLSANPKSPHAVSIRRLTDIESP
jgi:hypothetical protein